LRHEILAGIKIFLTQYKRIADKKIADNRENFKAKSLMFAEIVR
jgi:hypothetical protein